MPTASSKTLSSDTFGGMRLTKQRRVVYEVLVDGERDHPCANEVYERARQKMPSISLATVYNCLEALTQCGAVKQVNVDREASRYCPNLKPHAHFYCAECDGVLDIHLRDQAEADQPWILPEGTQLEDIEVVMKGRCPDCR